MCYRLSPLTEDEARAVLDARATPGAHALRYVEAPSTAGDAYPGSQVPLFVPDASGALAVQTLEWGFPLDGRPHAVFNTRIETALAQLEPGRGGMWARAIREGRCLVPVRAFYEPHKSEKVASPQTGRPVSRQYRFRLPGARAFLLAALRLDGCFSVVTTVPNESVAPVHDRMPLVLGPGESGVWLGSDFARLADRGGIRLAGVAEDENNTSARS